VEYPFKHLNVSVVNEASLTTIVIFNTQLKVISIVLSPWAWQRHEDGCFSSG